MDKYSCKCGQKYFTNSSLYNHIRLKHDNDLGMKQNILKMGRPIGTKNEVQIKRTKVKRVAYPCKCGSTLASRGALSNHWRLVHKSCEEFKPDVLEKGRKKASYDKKKIKVEKDDLVKQEYDDENIQQNYNCDSTYTEQKDEQVQESELKAQVKQENIPTKELIQVKQEQNDIQPSSQIQESSTARSEEQEYQIQSQATLSKSPFNSIELVQQINSQHIYPYTYPAINELYHSNYTQNLSLLNQYNLCNLKPQPQYQPRMHMPYYSLPQLDLQQQIYFQKIKAGKFNFLVPQS
ncbi:hypothetical protein ABPG74_009793 [Tetrahymena malaccensis]